MKIISLDVEGFMRVRAVRVEPDPSGGLVIIGGDNAQGKTSVIDAIMVALKGGRSLPERPIHEGHDAATITIDLGEIVVTKRITPSGPTLTVQPKEGARLNKPQAVLDTLYDGLTFDPLVFASADPKQQVDMLLSVIQLPLDLTAWEAERQAVYEKRTETNRETNRLDGVLAKMPMEAVTHPNQEVDIAALASEFAEAQAEQREIASLTTEHNRLMAELSDLQQRLANINARGNELNVRIDARAKAGRTVPALHDLMQQAEGYNENVRNNKRRTEVREERQASEAKSAALTQHLAMLQTQKEQALAAARLPVEGLSFDDTGILFNGIPFAQASGAERLRISTAIGMAMNPSLRVMLIRDGSLLDKTNLALLEQMAGEHDYQIWVERVGDGDAAAVVIEDGMVRPDVIDIIKSDYNQGFRGVPVLDFTSTAQRQEWDGDDE